jgi:6-phosphogluconolactonase
MQAATAPLEHRYSQPAAQAQGLARCIAHQLRTLLGQQQRVVLAVSGGKSPITLFEALRTQVLDWSRVDVTLVDERAVHEHHPDSNAHLVLQHLLQDAAADAHFVNWFKNLESPQALTPDALVQHVNVQLSKQLHGIDIAVLGMGEDGHTASWFPKSPGLGSAMQSTDWVTWVRPVAASHLRITLTKQTVLKAKYVHLAIAGASKVQVYERAKTVQGSNLPIAIVLHNHPTHQVWIAENVL